MNQTEIEVALAEHGKEIGSLKHQVDDMEKIADAVHSLAEQMAAQTAEIHHLSENVGEVKADVAELKAKPAARWENLVDAALGAVAGAASALIFK